MSAVFNKVCVHCGRPQLLWGGETCDVCDRDSNGVNDREEPVSIPSTVDEHLLFKPEEKGWMIVASTPVTFIGLPGKHVAALVKSLQRKSGLPYTMSASPLFKDSMERQMHSQVHSDLKRFGLE